MIDHPVNDMREPRDQMRARPAFHRLDPGKQRQIIEVCVDEFVEQGYRNASTNRIVRRLGIAKGSLFHYFGTKEQLYLYLLYRAGTGLLRLLERRYRGMPDDLCERLRRVTEASLEFWEEDPRMYRFFSGFADSGLAELQQKYALMFSPRERERIFYDVFQGVDTSRLRFGREQTFLLVRWLLAGLKQDLVAEINAGGSSAEIRRRLMDRLEVALEALQRGIYRDEAGEQAAAEREQDHGGG